MTQVDILDDDELSSLSDEERATKLRRHQEQADIETLMGTPAGRRFVWRLLDATKVFQTSMTGNSYTFFNEGRRDVGLLIFGEVMEVCPDLYVTMQNEAKEESNV